MATAPGHRNHLHRVSRLLVLDEPTSGLDPVARTALWEFLRDCRSKGVAVLTSTHDLAEAETYADRLLVLDEGRAILRGPRLRGALGSWRGPPAAGRKKETT